MFRNFFKLYLDAMVEIFDFFFLFILPYLPFVSKQFKEKIRRENTEKEYAEIENEIYQEFFKSTPHRLTDEQRQILAEIAEKRKELYPDDNKDE